MNQINLDVLNTPEFEEHSQVVFDSGLKEPTGTCIIVRQFHGSPNHREAMKFHPDFEKLFLDHQNAVRAVTHQLLTAIPEAYFFVEGETIKRDIPNNYWLDTDKFETVNGITPVNGISIPFLTGKAEDLAKQAITYTSQKKDSFMDSNYDRLIGSLRQAAWCVANGQNERVHGIENPYNELLPFYFDPLDLLFTGFEPFQRELNKLRDKNIVDGMRRVCHNGAVAVLTMGASHTRSGTKAPLLPNEYLEEVFSKELPSTRLIVVEPKKIVWHIF